MTNSVSGESETDIVLVARQVKRTCKAHGVKLSVNAFTCLNELCKGLFREVTDGMNFDGERSKELTFNANSTASYEQLKQTWMGILGVDHSDEELLPVLSRSQRVMELHWACMEKHVRTHGPVCCEEIQGYVEKLQVSGLLELVLGGKSSMANWVPLMTSVAMLDGIVDWVVAAAGLASQHLDE